jgi:hypothetical protein
MQTVYDWVTVAVFACLIVLFLQRSVQEKQVDTIWHYLPPAIGCALSNWLGNEGYKYPAVAVLGASIAYIIFVLKPSFLPRG